MREFETQGQTKTRRQTDRQTGEETGDGEMEGKEIKRRVEGYRKGQKNNSISGAEITSPPLEDILLLKHKFYQNLMVHVSDYHIRSGWKSFAN